MPYQVFIEKAVDPSSSGQAELAKKVAKNFGVPEDSLLERIKGGRFRVKANVELDVAEKFASMMERLGAFCSVIGPNGEIVKQTDPSTLPKPKSPGIPKRTLMGHVPATQQPNSEPAIESAPPPPLAKPAMTFGALDNLSESALVGLNDESDHLSVDAAVPPLKAPTMSPLSGSQLSGAVEDDFDNLTNPGWNQLSGVDGQSIIEDEPSESVSARGVVDGGDAFLPPEASQKNDPLLLDNAATLAVKQKKVPLPAPAKSFFEHPGLSDDIVETRQRETPQKNIDESVNEQPPTDDAPVKKSEAKEKFRWPPEFLMRLAKSSVLKMWVGMLFILVASFIPAHCVAHLREEPAYAEIRSEVSEAQLAVTDADSWDVLETYRSSKVDEMHHKRTNIAVSTFVLWMLLAAGLGFLYFRKIPWDRLAGSKPRAK